MRLAQGPQSSDASEAWTHGPSVSSQALYHCAPGHILAASLTLMALFLKTEPSELDWLQVYDMAHWWKIVLRTGPSLDFSLW